MGRASTSKQARRRLRAADRIGVVAGWCETEADLLECRQATHDTLIQMMGALRVGGVTWRQVTGQDAYDTLDLLSKDASRELLDYYRSVRAHLRERGGWVVVATAPGVLP